MSASQKIWLKQLGRYNDKSIEQFFKQYYIPLVLFGTTYVRDQDTAKDMVQDVFFTLINNRQQFDSIDNLKIYLYSSVKNKCLKFLRHEEVKGRYEQYVQANETIYQEAVLEEEVFVLLTQAINKLPEQCKKVFLLTLEGKSNSEIAEILGIGIETVKSHKKTGKKLLFAKLKNSISDSMFIFYLLYTLK